MALINVVPEFFDYLDSDLKKEEFGSSIMRCDFGIC
jgi:hypothetical protein